jgi:F0F1-type ATP synthase gamma subunit
MDDGSELRGQVALKNTTTNAATFISTYKQAFFKIRQAP